MGDNISQERPMHFVTLSDFWMGRYEVTVAQFSAFIKCSGYKAYADRCEKDHTHKSAGVEHEKCIHWSENKKRKSYSEKNARNYPVNVTWDDAVAYCKWLSENGDFLYRLPTEAEWEYAAKGGVHWKDGYRYSGSNNIHDVAWYSGNSNLEPHHIGTKAPNQQGIFDMTGNEWEWCSDKYDAGYYYFCSDSGVCHNPAGPKPAGSLTVNLVLRGGCFWGDTLESLNTFRFYGDEINFYGFRVVATKKISD